MTDEKTKNLDLAISQIEKQYGAAALSFVYSLYERNFVDFRPAEMAEVQ